MSKAMKNDVYYFPENTAPERADALELVKSKTEEIAADDTAGEAINLNNRRMVLPRPNHIVNNHHVDFSTFLYEPLRYNCIVAMSSVFYMLNNPEFEAHVYPFFKTLINFVSY